MRIRVLQRSIKSFAIVDLSGTGQVDWKTEWKSMPQSYKQVPHSAQALRHWIFAWSISILPPHWEIDEEENPTEKLLKLISISCSCLLQYIYCSYPHLSVFPPSFPQGTKWKQFCCGQVWNLSGSSPVVPIMKKTVIKGDKALRRLGGWDGSWRRKWQASRIICSHRTGVSNRR